MALNSSQLLLQEANRAAQIEQESASTQLSSLQKNLKNFLRNREHLPFRGIKP
jgi:hypothetical protein